MKTTRILLVAGLFMAGALCTRAQLVNGIKAVVDESVITFDEVESMTLPGREMLARQLGYRSDAYLKQVGDLVETNLQTLMNRQLVLSEFKTAGYSLPETMVDDLVQARIRSDYGDRVTLTKTLEARGMSFEKFRQSVRERFIIEQLRAKNISSTIIISPHKVEQYYLAHQQEYQVKDRVKLRMIVINKGLEENAPQALKRAEEILAKLKEGAVFAEMATTYSEGSQRKEGGNWGWVEQGTLQDELDKAAFAMKSGELSGIINCPDGYYIMRVEEASPAHFKALGEVRDNIEKELLLAEQSRVERQWMERLKKKTFVRYY